MAFGGVFQSDEAINIRKRKIVHSVASRTEIVLEINVGARSFALWPRELRSSLKYGRKILCSVASRTELFKKERKKEKEKKGERSSARTILRSVPSRTEILLEIWEKDTSLSGLEN